MFKRLTSLMFGNTLAALGIAMVINSELGCFAITAANLSVSNILGISLGTTSMLIELIMLSIATYRKEGIGLTAIVNATYGSYLIELFMYLLPKHLLLCLGLFIIPFGWAMMGKAGFGDTGSNILMNSLLKQSNKSMGIIRGILEILFLIIGYIGAKNYVTWFTLLLTFTLGYILQFSYKLIKYEPTKIKHKFIIGR